MNTEQIKERWHELKDKVLHWGRHGEEHAERMAKSEEEEMHRRQEEHKTDDIAGSD